MRIRHYYTENKKIKIKKCEKITNFAGQIVL